MSRPRMPLQPFMPFDQKVVRFARNGIVRKLLDHCSERGLSLNELVRDRSFTQEEWEQFYSLIGYSLNGFHELHLVSDETARAASAVARSQLQIDEPVLGCRDDASGCEIHAGVAREVARE